MTYDEICSAVVALLQQEGRVAYRVLKRRFDIDDEYVEDLKADLIEAKRVAIDENGKVLVWVGNTEEDKGKRRTDKEINGERENAGERGQWGKGEKEEVPSRWTPAHLAERIRAVSLTDGERKTITALFADLKGSTALIEGLDPEDARAIIDPALQLMMDAVHRYEGYVAQALGDGIFALFGAPIAHEDHPQRALYAALRMQEEMRRYGDQVRLKHGVPLAMRVGINTGEVVVRSIRKDDLHTDYVPVGHSTNLAARMEQMATPGSILITTYTYKLAEGYFEFRNLGATQIKGVEVPLHVYEVLGAGPLRTRLQVAAQRGLTRFVGRQNELEQMQKALGQVKASHGQIVGVMGEPGLGKSRLFYEFKLLSQSGWLILEAYSVSHGKASPYLPVIELLKSYFRIEPSDDERTRREKVAGKVVILDHTLEDLLPYLYALLGIEEQPSPLQQMDPQIRRKRTFEALKKLFLRESLNQPLILIFEDLHWIDSETQGFLDTLCEGIASAKILLLVNYRPEYSHDWGSKSYYTQLRLAPFGRAEAEEFLDELLGEHRFPLPRRERDRVRVPEGALQTLKHLILTKTDGTPFFMEEIVQELKEQGVLRHEASVGWVVTHPTLALHLPPTVQGVLTARIDRLAPEEKALLQQLAVIGREFPLGLIRKVISQPEDDLSRLLSSLQHKEFLHEQPAFPEVEYLFKHALTQEVAYNSVLLERRKVLHEQTAQAIEQLYHERLEEHYDALAHHYQHSSNREKAIEYLQKAGEQAVQRSANTEAIGYLTSAVALLIKLPDTEERARVELEIQLTLGVAFQASKGFTAKEVEATYARARELCRHIGESPQLFPVLRGLWQFYVARAESRHAREIGETLLRLAHSGADPLLLTEAYHTLGAAAYFQGEFSAAKQYLEQSLTLYEAQPQHTQTFRYGYDTKVGCLVRLAHVLWHLGYSDQGWRTLNAALSYAQEIHHPPTLGVVFTFSPFFSFLQRETHRALEGAEAMIAYATEYDLPFFLAGGIILRGWALAQQGYDTAGLEELRRGLSLYEASGTGTRIAYLVFAAETFAQVGQLDESLGLLARARTFAVDGGEESWLAEISRLQGELTLQKVARGWGLRPGSPAPHVPCFKPQVPIEVLEEAEGYFRKAIDIARQQQARSWELRATMSLARLWWQQGKGTEAHYMLSEIYNWFTEGFDTKDLQEAKALLEGSLR